MRFFFLLAAFHQLFHVGQCQEFSKATIERNQHRYEKYHQCLLNQYSRINELGTQPLQAKTVVQGASIKLDCFNCLSPQQQEYVEDMWKPNGGFFGRKVQAKLYELKQSIRHQLNISIDRPQVSWEFMPLKGNAKWRPVLDLSEPATFFRKFSKSIKEISSSASHKIGTWFELEIQKANQTHAGWYRCVQRSKAKNHISTLYFIDVLNSNDIQMRKLNTTHESNKKTILQEFPSGVQAFEESTPWTSCNKCGDSSGQKFRHLSCRLKQTPSSKLNDSRFEFLQLFGSVPCQSSLIPQDVRKQLSKHTDVYEFDDCSEPCLQTMNETRVIEQLSQTGEKEIIDELKPGEYSIHERLPPLKPRVGRHVVNKVEDDALVLDCGIVGGRAVLWHYDFNELNATTLLSNYIDRIIMSNEGHLIFRRLELSDRGLYSCFVAPHQLVRTFKLYVAESDRTAELASLIQMSIRFMSVFLLIVLVVTVVARTDTQNERRIRSE